MRWLRCVVLLPFALLTAGGPARAEGPAPPPERIAAERNYLTGWPARNPDGTINVVVEIPAGTNAKWEATPSGDALAWERQEGRLRVVRYLPYPGNYGMVPGTLQDTATGGDGDPLDVLVLGEAAGRGNVVAARPVGVLRLLDGGERDDKILAVAPDGPLGDVRDLAELTTRYPGVTLIVETWFLAYKGPGRMQSRGFADRAAAEAAVREAAAAFEASGGGPR